jgi:integrase
MRRIADVSSLAARALLSVAVLRRTGTTLTISVHSGLAAIIAATPTAGLTLLMTKSGKSGANKFSDQFRSWCDAAGLPQHCSFHGLRTAACMRLADCGCTVHEIAAISGHQSLKEIQRYTKAADQARLARAALERIANKSVKPEPDEVSKPLTPLAKTAEG